ncbi:uncharacterized protein OCT59_007734 [Rhizophagus irregularis]|uniref:uncharacterized protein n=1 Tax=Rhizophagus irregularis TaxID=588596 RepID=UPI00332D6D7E|nr:hypothetical protein OCT59_007734 [Rhizophagus irregularis]
MSEVFVKIDNEIDTEKIDVIDNDVIDKDNYHNGKPITEIEVSPNEKYLVTYSKEDRSMNFLSMTLNSMLMIAVNNYVYLMIKNLHIYVINIVWNYTI